MDARGRWWAAHRAWVGVVLLGSLGACAEHGGSGRGGTAPIGLPRGGARTLSSSNMREPVPRNSSCEYFLTELASDGALIGGSICSGMPQPTRLEVPRVAQAWLTRPELVTVLVAVLSSPPVVVSEENGPRFDNNPPEPPAPPPAILP